MDFKKESENNRLELKSYKLSKNPFIRSALRITNDVLENLILEKKYEDYYIKSKKVLLYIKEGHKERFRQIRE